jgi:hypothetical protein
MVLDALTGESRKGNDGRHVAAQAAAADKAYAGRRRK